MTPALSESTISAPAVSGGYVLYIIKCELRGGVLVTRGKRQTLSLQEAVDKFCKSSDPRAKANVLRARRGHYIGLRNKGDKLENFLIVNPTEGGDIRWLLRKNPELEASITEVYMVDEVNRAKIVSDLPTVNPSNEP